LFELKKINFKNINNFNYSTNTKEFKNGNKLPADRLKKFLNKLSLKPEAMFEKLELKETHNLIKKSLTNKSGIYLIVNLINEKFYIGSAVHNKLYSRFMNHLIYYTGSDLIAKGVEKYGLNNFAFVILEFYNFKIINKNDKRL
jgi:hypothetical protein